MTWNKDVKPPAGVCPERYCFHWVPPGGAVDMSGRSRASVEDAMAHPDAWKRIPEGGCGRTSGACKRLDPVAGDYDAYEPCEPTLDRDGLPWFYFIADADRLVPELRERYRRESRELWGDEET